MPVSIEYKYGCDVAVATGGSLSALSIVPPISDAIFDGNNPIRDFDALFLTDFFDHTGNFFDGTASAFIILAAGALVDKYISEDKKNLFRGGVALSAVTFASGVNIAYEAGVDMPIVSQNEASGFDAHDAAYGSSAGILLSLLFYKSAKFARKYLRREDAQTRTSR